MLELLEQMLVLLERMLELLEQMLVLERMLEPVLVLMLEPVLVLMLMLIVKLLWQNPLQKDLGRKAAEQNVIVNPRPRPARPRPARPSRSPVSILREAPHFGSLRAKHVSDLKY
jgi:hypothetical protein